MGHLIISHIREETQRMVTLAMRRTGPRLPRERSALLELLATRSATPSYAHDRIPFWVSQEY